MPYAKNRDLPQSVKGPLPEHAQDIYRSAFNSAFEQYDEPAERRGGASREEVAHKVAWAAVKEKYEKGGSGDWHAKG